MEIFNSKIKKLNNLKKNSDFIDLSIFYHLKKCVFADCDSCRFINRIIEIYLLFCPNQEKREKAKEEIVTEFQKNMAHSIHFTYF